MRNIFTLLIAIAGLAVAKDGLAVREPVEVVLPTQNRFLLTGEPEKFYMYIHRDFQNVKSQPWEGGSYGLVRNLQILQNEIISTKFHEGIDIQPLMRDAAGNPLDPVVSIADGVVVHISPLAARSNYGKYVIVEHRWHNSPIYSLYAHLSEIYCSVGDRVKAGKDIARMGFTGEGIDRARAHVHFEIGFYLSNHYDAWSQRHGKGANYQGNFNGMNLSGINAADFYLSRQKNPTMSFREFIATIPVYFKVAVPAVATAIPDFVKMYPWMAKGTGDNLQSWEISFSQTGQPLEIVASNKIVDAPVIIQITPSTLPQRYLTRNLVVGEGNRASLSKSGLELVDLILGTTPNP